jgi:hypothetical protein
MADSSVALVPPGRNQPCRCGSGKKYKQCCLARDETGTRGPEVLLERAARLTADVAQWAERRFGAEWLDPARELAGVAALTRFPLVCATQIVPVRGQPVSAWYAQTHPHLSSPDRALLASLGGAWTSLWEVGSMADGEHVLLHDRLTGAQQTLRLNEWNNWLEEGDLLLARVAEHEGIPLLHSAHRTALKGDEAAAALAQARERLGPEALSADLLRHPEVATKLIGSWEDSCDKHLWMAERSRFLRDGFVDDRFELLPANRAEVLSRLLALSGASREDEWNAPVTICFCEPGSAESPDDGETLGTGSLWERELFVQSDSTADLDALRARVESACGDLVRHTGREGHQDDPSSDDDIPL